MTQHDDTIWLRHILDHAREAAILVHATTREDLHANRVLSLALVCLLEIVGGAATRVSADVRAQHPQIAWRPIISLRNRLIHGYDAVDLDILVADSARRHANADRQPPMPSTRGMKTANARLHLPLVLSRAIQAQAHAGVS